jgi:purine-nucleoside phosphorylase
MAKWISQRANSFKPLVAIICGSGLGEIADLVEEKIIIPYTEIPEFPRSTGKLRFYRLN